MGTPDFAVASLDALVRGGFPPVAVVTAPDKPAGRGQQLQQSAVKRYALEHQLPVLQPARLKDPAFLEALRACRPDLQVVVAFRMLPEVVWDLPPQGTINLHASLLPRYRGAAPIHRAIMNGETETGITTFRLQHEIDTGSLIYQERLPIGPEETAGELHDRLMTAGAALLLKTVEAIAAGDFPLQPQPTPEGALATAPKIFRADAGISWARPVREIFNHIRGLSPHPGAWTLLNGKSVKIYRCRVEPRSGTPPPGTVQIIDGALRVSAADGWVYLLELQQEGKKKMSAEEFLRGWRAPGADAR